MNKFMSFLMVALSKLFITKLATVWLFASMNKFMSLDISDLVKFLWAIFAGIRLDTTVKLFMLLK